MNLIDRREPVAHDGREAGRGIHAIDEIMKLAPARDARANDLREEVGGKLVVVTPVAAARHALDDTAVEQASGFGADARFADAERLGELVEGERGVAEEKEAEQPS